MTRGKWGWVWFLIWAVCYAAAWRLNWYGFPNYRPKGVWPVAASVVVYAMLLAATWFSGQGAIPAWRVAAAVCGGLLLLCTLCAVIEPLSMFAILILYLALGFYGLVYPFSGLFWVLLALLGGLLVFAAWRSRRNAA